jgi:hypothetical protein
MTRKPTAPVAKSSAMTESAIAAAEAAAATVAATVTTTPTVAAAAATATAGQCGAGGRRHSEQRCSRDRNHLPTHHGDPPFVARCTPAEGNAAIHGIESDPSLRCLRVSKTWPRVFSTADRARRIRIKLAPRNTQMTNATVPDE